MLQFVAGFVLAVAAVVPVGLVLLRRKIRGARRAEQGHLESLEELSKLTGGLAHEIKNPLSTVKVNLKLIGEDLESALPGGNSAPSVEATARKLERAMRKITVVRKEADRLEHILDGFLRYADRAQPELASVNINDVMTDMIDFYSPQAHSRSITIRQALDAEPIICKVDADMLKQAVLNLFINAQQAMTGGGELIITTTRNNRDALIQITDTGPGIPPDRLARIFDAYHSSRPQGSGLGLPTARKMIEALGGTLSVESERGRGASFTIRVPVSSK